MKYGSLGMGCAPATVWWCLTCLLELGAGNKSAREILCLLVVDGIRGRQSKSAAKGIGMRVRMQLHFSNNQPPNQTKPCSIAEAQRW